MRTEAGIHVAIAAVLTAVAAAIFVSLWVGGGPVQGAEHDPAADLSPAPPASVGMQSQDPVADLVLIKEVAPRRVRPGSKVTYTISVTNLGPGSATAVTLIDTLPEGTSPAKGNCEGRRIKCYLGTIGGGESTTLTLDVNVAPDARGSLRNKATVSSLTDDPDMANNEAVATVRVQPPQRADLRISKTLDSEEVLAGGTVRYSVRVTNAGPHAATAVTLIDTLPAEMSPSLRNCPGRRILCYLGTIASGKTVTVEIDVNLAQEASGDLRNSASVSSLTTDPRLSNNEASVVMSVAEPKARDPTPTPTPTASPTPTPVPTVIVPEAEITPVPALQGPGWESVTAVVHPDRVTRVALPEHGLLLTFPAISRARTFQVRVTAYDEARVLQDPPPGLVLTAVAVEVFDTHGNLLEGVRLIFPANVEMKLNAGQIEAVGGPGELFQQYLRGGLALWTRSAPEDPWRQVKFNFRLGQEPGSVSASVRLRYFSDFALVLEQEAQPDNEVATPTPPPTPMPPPPPSVGDASMQGPLVFAPGLAGLLLVLAGAAILKLGDAVLALHGRR